MYTSSAVYSGALEPAMACMACMHVAQASAQSATRGCTYFLSFIEDACSLC